jgi:molecular chaperone GrpE
MTGDKKENKNRPDTDKDQTLTESVTDAKLPEEMTKDELVQFYKEAKEQSEKNYDLYLRSQAEMENMRKRNKREKEDWLKYANETLIKSLLPSLDNLEKAMDHAGNENAIHALREGIELTLKGLKDTLSKAGLVEVRSMGEPFDPCYHEAVSQIQKDQVKPGTIVEELQKGYVLNDRLIRPAVVVVSKAGASSPADQGGSLAGACEKI